MAILPFQSTRPLRGATALPFRAYALVIFQPTRPLRGATVIAVQLGVVELISTHAPLAGRDQMPDIKRLFISNFNPRAPCGARLGLAIEAAKKGIFQPTRPLRGATGFCRIADHRNIAFQPTRPLRGATQRALHYGLRLEISTHAPLAGRDAARNIALAIIAISTHAPLAGRDGISRVLRDLCNDFNPRAPCGARRALLRASTSPFEFQPTRPLRGATIWMLKQLPRLERFQPTRPLRGATEPTEAPFPFIAISTHAPLAGRDESLEGV